MSIFRLLVLGVMVLASSPAAAQMIYEVDTTIDNNGLRGCTSDSIDCSLRGAITNANTDGVPSQIILGDETYQLTLIGSNEDNNETGDLDVLMPVEIVVAPGAAPVIEQTTIDRVMDTNIANATFRMVGPITITGGRLVEGDIGGGAIRSSVANGSLELEDVILADAQVTGRGGCLYYAGINASSLSLLRVTLSDCHSENFGGGAYLTNQAGPAASIVSSRIEDNSALNSGGGLEIQGATSVVILDTTVRGNVAGTQNGGQGDAGGIYHNSTSLVVRQSTVSNNQVGIPGSTQARGGGIFTSGSTVLIENSTISGNRTAGTDQSGAGIYVSAFGGTALTLDSSSVVDNPTGGEHAIWMPGQGGASLTLKNSIIDDGCTGGIASILSDGFNVERPWDGSTNTTCNLTDPSDVQVTDLMLLPLAGYGGPTYTHALLPGSPAQLLVSSVQCQAEDQRHAVRQGLFCDAGAYDDSTEAPGQWIFADGFESGDVAAWSGSSP